MDEADTLAHAQLPTPHQVQACQVALEVVGDGAETAALRNSYRRYPSNGMLSLRDLLAAEKTLLDVGLLVLVDERVVPSEPAAGLRSLGQDYAPEVLLSLLLAAEPPVWLYAATRSGNLHEELVPDHDLRVLQAFGFDADRRDALLLASAIRHDGKRNTEIGNAGEEAVVVACQAYLTSNSRPDLAQDVHRVSLISDQLGYDVKSPDLAGKDHRLEVKTTTSDRGPIVVYLSRNEAFVGLQDPTWSLVACRHSEAGTRVVGWCAGELLRDRLPVDPPTGGRWMSAAVTLHAEDLTEGLPLTGGDCRVNPSGHSGSRDLA